MNNDSLEPLKYFMIYIWHVARLLKFMGSLSIQMQMQIIIFD